MDGLTALPQAARRQARPQGHHRLDADAARRRYQHPALAAGAADYLTKPGSLALSSADQFKRELVAKVKVPRPCQPRRRSRCVRRAACRAPRRPADAASRSGAAARHRAAPGGARDPRRASPSARRPADRRRCSACSASSRARVRQPDLHHPAHAGHLHHHPRRAHRARERLSGARGGRWRAGRGRAHLCRARRFPHDRRDGGAGQPRHAAHQGAAREFLPARRSIRCCAAWPQSYGPRVLLPSC